MRLFGLGLFSTLVLSYLPFCLLFYVFRILSVRFLRFVSLSILYHLGRPHFDFACNFFRVLASDTVMAIWRPFFVFALISQPVLHFLHALLFSSPFSATHSCFTPFFSFLLFMGHST